MDEFIWCEKFRPKTIDETILPQELKLKLRKFIEQKNVPNLLLTGGPGVGKTTAARAVLEELGCEYIMINGSMEGGIETLRSRVQAFASSISMLGGRKYVILDEADYLSQMMQPALRNFMEEFSANCGFILTCNYKNRIIKELHSRCAVVEFIIPAKEKPQLAGDFLRRATEILEAEGIEYDKKVIAALIKKHFPDWRKILNILQYESAAGKIDTRVLSNIRDVTLRDLFGHMKAKNFTAVRKWVADNSNIDSAEFYRKFYDAIDEYVASKDIPFLVVITAKYLYQDAMAADKEINLAAFLCEVMANCEIK